jgi:hypothetical protein
MNTTAREAFRTSLLSRSGGRSPTRLTGCAVTLVYFGSTSVVLDRNAIGPDKRDVEQNRLPLQHDDVRVCDKHRQTHP